MSAVNPNETAKSWHAHGREATVQLYLSSPDGAAADAIGARVAGFPLSLQLIPVTEWIDPQEINAAAAAVVQVDADSPASIKRFERIAEVATAPLIAACYEPPLSLVRSLLRAGAHDVIPLPLDLAELESSLLPVNRQMADREVQANVATGRLVSVIKSGGGTGATALLTQLATRFAQREAAYGREACVIDFDLQFGDAAFQLGLRPGSSLVDLIEAGARLDGDLLRHVCATHHSGLKLIAAPPAMMPLEALSSEQVIALVERAQREFGTLFVDLPGNWTNWSLSLLARSDLVLLVTGLSVASLNRARKQLDLLAAQELGELDVRVVVNRFEKGLLRTVRTSDVQSALGRTASFVVANDPELMNAAIDRGVPISEIRRKSSLARDLDTLDTGLAAALGLERS